ncbi:hypothetical protein AXK57_02400 [Tsukamurella pulmonis]|uniref:hypothetical protein n=1 Tax=Tsukamurella pulmonis TaxID=47312 RepID=UPI00079AB63E|nr:hypothetical protein [Tsukamurella pulmonis]KXP13102.1 hypothetical protein AXK57_02400 [Tsukamurella pulmonis]RDH10753.1 hypothetical protein DVB88_16195 [Tsukamurella pulmonis]
MSAGFPLVTVFLRPADESRVLAAIGDRLGADADAFAFTPSPDDPSLRLQWVLEHPQSPPADRRCAVLWARFDEADLERVAEAAIDVLSPHARTENAAILAGREVRAVPDEFPWYAHVPLWDRVDAP